MLLFLVFWFLNLFVVWLFVDGVVFFYVFFISIVFLFVCFFTFASRESVLFVVFFNICFSVFEGPPFGGRLHHFYHLPPNRSKQ